jgi:hypothetical protein
LAYRGADSLHRRNERQAHTRLSQTLPALVRHFRKRHFETIADAEHYFVGTHPEEVAKILSAAVERVLVKTLFSFGELAMNLLRYLFRESKTLLLIAIFAAVISGAAGAFIAKTISDAVIEGGQHSGPAVLFFGLCLIYFGAKSCSEISLMHLVQTSILRMRVDLSRKILALPLKRLEAIGNAELFRCSRMTSLHSQSFPNAASGVRQRFDYRQLLRLHGMAVVETVRGTRDIRPILSHCVRDARENSAAAIDCAAREARHLVRAFPQPD